MSNVHERKLAILRAKLDRKESAPLGIEAECAQLRFQVAGLDVELVSLTQRFATLDHSWDEERVVLEARRAKASNMADGLTLELVQARAYIHSTLSMEQGQEGDKPSEPQLAFCRLQIELAEREEALRVVTVEVGTPQVLLETEKHGSTYNSTTERKLACLQHLYDKLPRDYQRLGL